MASYHEIRNTSPGNTTAIASHAHPAVPSRHHVDHQDAEEGNDTAQEEAVGQEAWAWEEDVLGMTEEKQGSFPGQVEGRACPA